MFHPKSVFRQLYFTLLFLVIICFPPPQKKQKSQQLVAAGKVFGFLGFCFYFLLLIAVTVPRLVFRGRKHRTVRFVFKKFGD